MSYHLTTVRMDITKNQEIKSVGEDAKKRKSVHRWWECKPVQPLWDAVRRFLKKLRNPLYDPAIPFLEACPKKLKVLTQKYTCTLPPLQPYLQWLKYGNDLSVHQQMNG